MKKLKSVLIVVLILGQCLICFAQEKNETSNQKFVFKKDDIPKKKKKGNMFDDYKKIYKNSEGKIITKKEFSKEVKENNRFFGYEINNEEKILIVTLTSDKDLKKEEAKQFEYRSKWENKPMRAFNFKDLEGKSISLNDYKGKVVVLNFWATWCKPCIKEMPELNKLVKEYDNKDVIFLAPALEDVKKLKSFLAKRNFEYKVLPNFVEFNKTNNIYQYPTHMIVDKNGVVRKVMVGATENIKSMLSGYIDNYL